MTEKLNKEVKEESKPLTIDERLEALHKQQKELEGMFLRVSGAIEALEAVKSDEKA